MLLEEIDQPLNQIHKAKLREASPTSCKATGDNVPGEAVAVYDDSAEAGKAAWSVIGKNALCQKVHVAAVVR